MDIISCLLIVILIVQIVIADITIINFMKK